MLHYLPFYSLSNQLFYIQVRLYCTTSIVDPIYNRPCICCVLSVHSISMVGPSLFKPCKCSTPLEVDSAYNRPCFVPSSPPLSLFQTLVNVPPTSIITGASTHARIKRPAALSSRKARLPHLLGRLSCPAF